MNYYLIGAGILIVVILAVVFYPHFKKPQPTIPAYVASATLTSIVDSLKSHVDNAVADLRAEFHPAAPAPIAAGLPPTVAAPNPPTGAPSGSGGTVQVVVTASDAVTAKHAHYAGLIAAGKQAEADDAALTAKEAELAELAK